MQTVQRNLFTREDTFFGVCEALGEDLRFHPNILRVALAGLLFFNPAAAFGGYAAAGVLVLATRLLFPNPVAKVEPQRAEAPQLLDPSTSLTEPTSIAAEEADRVPLAA